MLKCGAHVDTWHDAIRGKSNGWWIKLIRNPRSQLELDMWQRGEQKGEISSPFWLRCAVGERGEKVLKNGGFLERESLGFPAFRPSDRFGPRSKVVLHGEGYVWALVLGSFDNSKR